MVNVGLVTGMRVWRPGEGGSTGSNAEGRCSTLEIGLFGSVFSAIEEEKNTK